MPKGTQNAQMQGPKPPRDNGGWAIDQPGQAREGFGGGPSIANVR